MKAKKDEPAESSVTEPAVIQKPNPKGWKDEDIVISSETASIMRVCAKSSLSVEQIEQAVKAKTPTWLKPKGEWKLSTDKTFFSGEANPSPCKQHPDRTHYLLSR